MGWILISSIVDIRRGNEKEKEGNLYIYDTTMTFGL